MSTGKRLAKRSIIGTRVCAPGPDGKYYSGVIAAVKTPATFAENNNCINLTPHTRYAVRFDPRQSSLGRTTVEYLEGDIIGPGFRSVHGLHLEPGQKGYVTYKGREVTGEVVQHDQERDEVTIQIGNDIPFQVQVRLEEVRLLESRKSARLADSDTDFARLADMAGERSKRSHTIDVPATSPNGYYTGSRKRRPSASQDETSSGSGSSSSAKDPQLDECSAALVLMSLSCSPHSPNLSTMTWAGTSPGSTSSGSSYRYSPSPPPTRQSVSPVMAMPVGSVGSDEGIVSDYLDEMPRKKKSISCIVYKCTWPGCGKVTKACGPMEEHIRDEHLIPGGIENVPEHEEEFYYDELELSSVGTNALKPTPQLQPTLSHRDMARPPHEDPEYQRQLVGSLRQQYLSGPIAIPQSPHKLLKLSPRPHSPKTPASPRRVRGENKKCRKVYGMEHKEQWCTQCKWKKACSRFGD